MTEKHSNYCRKRASSSDIAGVLWKSGGGEVIGAQFTRILNFNRPLTDSDPLSRYLHGLQKDRNDPIICFVSFYKGSFLLNAHR